MEVVVNPIRAGDRDRSITDAADTETYTAENWKTGTNRTGVQEETIDSGEEMGVVEEATGTHPTSHTTKLDRDNRSTVYQITIVITINNYNYHGYYLIT